MIRSELKKRAQLILHGKYGNWSFIVLIPFVIGLLFFIWSVTSMDRTPRMNDTNQYHSWQEKSRNEYRGLPENEYDTAFEEGYDAGFEEGYDEGWSDGWDDSLMEENEYYEKPDDIKGEEMNPLSHSMLPINHSGRAISHGYRTSVEISIGGFLFFLFSLVMSFLMVLYQGMLKWAAVDSINGLPFSLKSVWMDFITRNIKRVSLANFFVVLYTFLWSLLFIIPGVIKGASYSMTNYLLKKDEQLSAKEAIILSQKLMNGYKMEYLIFRASFILWSYASLISFGLVSFYVLPYYNVSEALFFDQIVAEKHHLFTDEQEEGFKDF